MKNPYKTEHPTDDDLTGYQAYELAREDAIKMIETVKNPYARVNNNILDHYFEEIKAYFLVEIRKREIENEKPIP